MRQSMILHHAVKCTKEEAYSYFIDIKKFGQLHPVIHTVTQVEPALENSMGKYFIQEAITMFGIIKLKPEYVAEVIEVDPGNKIKYTSQVKAGIDLEINFEFSDWENGYGTIIKEEVIVTAYSIICNLFLRQIRMIHLDLIEALERNFTR